MKKIVIKNRLIGSGMKYLGWSGRGWSDGGPIGAGPLNCQAPSWDSFGQEIGINMVRMGFSIKHFLSERDMTNSPKNLSDLIKKGLENKDVSWAKSAHTSYSSAIQRCSDLGWKILICINPSYKSDWDPKQITQSTHSLQIWKNFCFHLSKSIEENWPGMAEYFEITNEPDIGYFDGESFLPDYNGPRGGMTPFQYCCLLQNAYEGIKNALPKAKIIGPGLASWNQRWIEDVLAQSSSCLDGISYHNVGGHLKDEEILKDAERLLEKYETKTAKFILNSEWAWWPNHDTNTHETALRIAQILHLQAAGKAYGSLYLGPAQPKAFSSGLGVLKFDPDDPNSVEKTKTFFAFRMMARGILGGNQLEMMNPFNKLKTLTLLTGKNEIVMTVINPSTKKFKNLGIDIDLTLNPRKNLPLKLFKFDHDHLDSKEEANYKTLKKFHMNPESILQFVFRVL
ncbi:hypothetical protein ACFLQZ_02365 [Acidobacteriota bacterium]